MLLMSVPVELTAAATSAYKSAPVVALERQAHDEPLTLRLLPVDLEAALRLVREQQQIGTVRAVNADAAPARHVADDRIAGHRLATLRVANHQPVDALNANALRAAHAVDESLEDVGLRRLAFLGVGIEMLDRERDVDVALADRRQQVRRIGETQLARRGVELVVVGLA